MLQRAWNPNPQSLPFAPYIRNHALVSLVQKGLQYHEIEQSLDEASRDPPGISMGWLTGVICSRMAILSRCRRLNPSSDQHRSTSTLTNHRRRMTDRVKYKDCQRMGNKGRHLLQKASALAMLQTALQPPSPHLEPRRSARVMPPTVTAA